MQILDLTKRVFLGKTLGNLSEGSWLMHDLNAFEIAQMATRGTAKVREYRPTRPLESEPEALPILVMRSGAIGDLLLLTPALLAFQKKTKRQVYLCCFKHHQDVVKWTPGLNTIPYPLSWEDENKFHQIISLENTMECDHMQHATDVFAKTLGIETPLGDYRPIYHVTESEREEAKRHLFKNRPNIVIQMRASVANRDYTPSGWLEVIVKLEKRGWGVLLVGHKGQVPELPAQFQNPFIRDLSRLDLTFRETAAVLAQAQAFLGIDSAWAHMCHALDIPAVVLFGPFSWHTRTAKAPKTTAIQGVGPCAPCNWHMHAGQMFPPNKPCTRIQQCVVLAEIEPSRILAKVDLLKP